MTQRYTRQGLGALFLTCAFPLHLWTLILAFRDISWLAQRTNLWDAIGVVSYGLVFAFVESVVIFVVLVLVGFSIPSRWSSDRRVAFLALLLIIISVWAMIGQLLMIWNVPLPGPAIQFLRNSDHPLRMLYAFALAVVVPTVVLPVYLFLRSRNAVPALQNFMERISLLTIFYLCLDVLGLVIVVIRNLS